MKIKMNEYKLVINPSGGSFYWHGLTLIPAGISNHMPRKVWDEIIYPFSNFNGVSGLG